MTSRPAVQGMTSMTLLPSAFPELPLFGGAFAELKNLRWLMVEVLCGPVISSETFTEINTLPF